LGGWGIRGGWGYEESDGNTQGGGTECANEGANELDEGLVGGIEETEAAGGGGEGGKEPADGWELAAGAGKVA
jgi:hypothetical protein